MFFPHNFIISENELPVTLFSTNDSILETIGPQAEAKKIPRWHKRNGNKEQCTAGNGSETFSIDFKLKIVYICLILFTDLQIISSTILRGDETTNPFPVKQPLRNLIFHVIRSGYRRK